MFLGFGQNSTGGGRVEFAESFAIHFKVETYVTLKLEFMK
jgi:hypothetical protein